MPKYTAKHVANLKEALVMWETVPPENVSKALANWREGHARTAPPTCGTIACFGGWCAWWPAFAPYVAAIRTCGEPVASVDEYDAGSLAAKLFGDEKLFTWRGNHRTDRSGRHSDHAVVTHRLQTVLREAEAQLN